MLADGIVAKRAGTVPQNEAQTRSPEKGGSDFLRKLADFVPPGSVWLSLVCDERPAQFKKDKFIHVVILLLSVFW